MQYGLRVNKYEEVGQVSNIKRKAWTKTSVVKLLTILITGILFGRVNLLLNQSDNFGIAPMGIAYLIAVVTKENKKNSLIAAIGIVVGYLTINKLNSRRICLFDSCDINNNVLCSYSIF